MKLSISRRGVELETTPRTRTYTNWQWAKPSLIFAWPGELYRIVARRQITRLLEENRRLRRGHQQEGGAGLRMVERLAMTWLDRRYPPEPPPMEIVEIEEP